jgi:hypothetical protein
MAGGKLVLEKSIWKKGEKMTDKYLTKIRPITKVPMEYLKQLSKDEAIQFADSQETGNSCGCKSCDKKDINIGHWCKDFKKEFTEFWSDPINGYYLKKDKQGNYKSDDATRYPFWFQVEDLYGDVESYWKPANYGMSHDPDYESPKEFKNKERIIKGDFFNEVSNE